MSEAGTSKTKKTENWFKALEPDELDEGRVKQVTCGTATVCVTHFEGSYAALDNKCPHQNGPLGEGSIENGFLRCPWHGWDFHPTSGKPPGGYDDGVPTYAVEVRDDGIYVGFPESSDHQKTVSDLMAESLVNWDVRFVFGMVGHSNLGLADAIRRQVDAGKMHYVGIRHEGAASFAASAFGKLTGKPAACFAIAGPGATNLLTGLWDANVDRAPVIALTGQVDTQVLGPGAFQEVDLQAAYGKVAQWSQTVNHDSRHAELVNLSVKSAVLNRGVSHLIFPDEVQTLSVSNDKPAGSPEGRVSSRDIRPPRESLDRAVELLRRSKRPAIIVGHGARFEMESVRKLAETLACPVLTTFKGKGLISDTHPLGCGVLGRSGTPIASWFMNESDCLLVFGASFSNHTGITDKKPTIQVDYDPMILGKFHAVEVPIWGEVGVTARELIEAIAEIGPFENRTDEIAARWKIWRAEKSRRALDNQGQGVSAAALFESMSRKVPKDALIAVDVGNNTYSFGRYFECEGQSVVMSGYLGSIGFALPAAMGLWAATMTEARWAARKVVSISGDGGFGQYMAEFNTAVKYSMPITHVLLSNGQLGKISKEQRAGAWDVWETSLSNPDFAEYARLCGGQGLKVSSPGELDGALDEALAHEGPSLVEVVSDPSLI